MHKLRKRGLLIDTIDEEHGGPYHGTHARYVLRTRVEFVEAEEPTNGQGPAIEAEQRAARCAAPVNSEPLKAAKGKGYALDKNGRKLVFTVEKAGTPLAVTIFDRWGN